jgi:flagellar biosynthesis protein FlhF
MATRTKHYEAELKDLDHLLQVIESEMGPDAQLETMEYTKGGIMGLGGRKMISITATVEVNPQRIGSGIRRTVKLDENWTTGERPDDAAAAPEAPAVEPEDEKLIDMARRRAVPTGGGMAREVPAAPRTREPQPDVVKPAVVAAAEPAAAEPAPVESTPVEAQVAATAEPVASAPAQERRPEIAAVVADSAEVAEVAADEANHFEQFAASMHEIREAVERIAGESELVLTDEAHPEEYPAAEPEPDAAVAATQARMAESLRAVFDRLVDWNIRSADALKLIDLAMSRYSDDAQPSSEGLFTTAVMEMLRPLQAAPGIQLRPGERRVVALIGSTGTGKTSIAAKLAARYAYERDLSVALVSMDTYRIAAVDQLRTFAEVMGFPLEIAYTAEDLARLSDELRADLIIVDTAGRSPLNTRQLDELQSAFALRRPDEVHLALPATMRYDDLALTLEAFRPLQPTATIVTKLDETRTLGMLHNLSHLHGPPVSFYSTGQAIPEDLHEAQPGFLVGWAEGLGYR